MGSLTSGRIPHSSLLILRSSFRNADLQTHPRVRGDALLGLAGAGEHAEDDPGPSPSRRHTAFAKPFVWWVKDRLDVTFMARAAKQLEGRHDFSAFTDRHLAEEDSRIVVVERCEVVAVDDLILVRIAASHFLWKMVRK